jgi:hypothetical protein
LLLHGPGIAQDLSKKEFIIKGEGLTVVIVIHGERSLRNGKIDSAKNLLEVGRWKRNN